MCQCPKSHQACESHHTSPEGRQQFSSKDTDLDMKPSLLLLGAVWSSHTLASPVPQMGSGTAGSRSATVTSSASAYPLVVEENGYTSASFHGVYTGTPTATGAVNASTTLALSIAAGPANPTATYYNSKGVPLDPFPAPFTPAGGLGTNGSLPRYMVESDFDFESIALGLYQEWIELDLFHYGLAHFTDAQFIESGLGPQARSLINFMANQEAGRKIHLPFHTWMLTSLDATLLTNMLGVAAPKECYYNYPDFQSPREWVDFMQRLTRFGESGM
jgi:hypothetical protein